MQNYVQNHPYYKKLFQNLGIIKAHEEQLDAIKNYKFVSFMFMK
jgi:hypothetical protein